MTDPKNQNCSNCDSARRIPVYSNVPGKGVQQTSMTLRCCHNPPPWYPVKPDDWCKQWSEEQ